ncbi:hypothetical protein Dhaf_4513 [Desulfitobacterium hafniense DCB-2]|uniref:Uncharacterized protein n=1 Tax=Desulfitobacterium hafniense (strain DSM 10664 / DCB-2) TaxID=272564 RepID=B8FWL6_DESHD|nr:hypothetical protein Dhaf_4513 [Desulfitobacterium hafniense DCB-2]
MNSGESEYESQVRITGTGPLILGLLTINNVIFKEGIALFFAP